MKRASKKKKPYWEMNTKELARATAEFDREFVVDEFGPPSPAAMAHWRQAKAKSMRTAIDDK